MFLKMAPGRICKLSAELTCIHSKADFCADSCVHGE